MGCDIHMAYQRVSRQQTRENKLSDVFEDNATKISSKWEYIDDGIRLENGWGNPQFSNEDRNYYWFGRMSEVRGDGPRITEPGFPDDVNHKSHDHYSEDDDGRMWLGDHSFSHVYLNTLLEQEWDDEDKSNMGTFIYDDIPRMIEYCEREGLKPEEFRILIGYDS